MQGNVIRILETRLEDPEGPHQEPLVIIGLRLESGCG
jgi:hypothetical protein